MGAGRLDQLRRLVMNPGWLEAKLHAYGIGAVVRDFRRWVGKGGNRGHRHLVGSSSGVRDVACKRAELGK